LKINLKNLPESIDQYFRIRIPIRRFLILKRMNKIHMNLLSMYGYFNIIITCIIER
jgi:hypothetical protein